MPPTAPCRRSLPPALPPPPPPLQTAILQPGRCEKTNSKHLTAVQKSLDLKAEGAGIGCGVLLSKYEVIGARPSPTQTGSRNQAAERGGGAGEAGEGEGGGYKKKPTQNPGKVGKGSIKEKGWERNREGGKAGRSQSGSARTPMGTRSCRAGSRRGVSLQFGRFAPEFLMRRPPRDRLTCPPSCQAHPARGTEGQPQAPWGPGMASRRGVPTGDGSADAPVPAQLPPRAPPRAGV